MINNCVKTAFFLPRALKGDGTIVYYVVRTDGDRYYIQIDEKRRRDVTDKRHLFIQEAELKSNIYELFGKEVKQ